MLVDMKAWLAPRLTYATVKAKEYGRIVAHWLGFNVQQPRPPEVQGFVSTAAFVAIPFVYRLIAVAGGIALLFVWLKTHDAGIASAAREEVRKKYEARIALAQRNYDKKLTAAIAEYEAEKTRQTPETERVAELKSHLFEMLRTMATASNECWPAEFIEATNPPVAKKSKKEVRPLK